VAAGCPREGFELIQAIGRDSEPVISSFPVKPAAAGANQRQVGWAGQRQASMCLLGLGAAVFEGMALGQGDRRSSPPEDGCRVRGPAARRPAGEGSSRCRWEPIRKKVAAP